MAAGMLTVVNPRRRRRSTKRRRATARKPAKRRRRRAVARVANPRRRRRASARRVTHRRRRHHNPITHGGMFGGLMKGLVAGGGAIATNLATNGVNHLLGASALTGPSKIALKAGVGLIALPMVLGFVPGGKKFAAHVRLGAGIAIAFDIYEQYVKGALPAYLQDYQYGSLNDYQYGALNGWAPQAAMSGAGDSTYDGGVYS